MNNYKRLYVGKASQYHMYEHHMVWMRAHGDIPEGKVIDHINENKADNRLENLQLLTHGQNNRRSVKGNIYKLSGNRSRPYIGQRQAFKIRFKKTFGTPGGAQMFINTCLLGGSTCAMS